MLIKWKIRVCFRPIWIKKANIFLYFLYGVDFRPNICYILSMTINQLINHPILGTLSPEHLKAYLLLRKKAERGIVSNFTIRGLVREWLADKDTVKMPTGKNTVKAILRDLEELKVVSYNQETEQLTILILE